MKRNLFKYESNGETDRQCFTLGIYNVLIKFAYLFTKYIYGRIKDENVCTKIN